MTEYALGVGGGGRLRGRRGGRAVRRRRLRGGARRRTGGQGGQPGGQGARGGGPRRSASSAQVNQTEGGYYGRIIIDPNDDKVLYCGDTNTTVSSDSGRTFAATGWDGTGKTHVDHRVVWVDPLNSNHILSGNDGGVSETWNGGKNFSQKNAIRAQQFYDVSVDNEQPYNVMGGTQDNGSWIGPSQNRNSYGIFAVRLEVPAGGRRVRRRPRLVEPGVHLHREPVRRVEPAEPRTPARRASSRSA